MTTSSKTSNRNVPANWSADDIPSQKGKIAIVTGANAGIGFEAALQLARHGAHVVLACRNTEKAEAAATRIRETIASAESPGSVEIMSLDTSSQESVRAFATQFRASHDKLNLLVNNAGVYAIPLGLTVDGHERQFATNHLGHFALTAQLFDLLKRGAPDARVVSVSSILHRDTHIVSRESIQVTSERDYSASGVYSQTKLYNLLFTKELARRIEASGVSGVRSVACHPGVTRTNIFDAPATQHGWFKRLLYRFVGALPFFQDAADGALPTLYASTGTNVQNSDYYGPDGFRTMRGKPTLEEPSKEANSTEFAKDLWEESEKLTGIKFNPN